MNKIILTLGLMFVSGIAMANPLYITLRAADGTERSFSTVSLSMTVGSDGKLLVSNAEKSMEFDLSSLVSMRFTDEASGVDEIEKTDTVTVFSMKGEKLGVYKSGRAAESVLPTGTYIFKSADKTEKRIIK